MSFSPSRRQIETLLAAVVAVATAVVGLSAGDEQVPGPKFIALQRIARMKKPVYLTQPPGSNAHLFVVQKAGMIRVLTNDRLQPRPFLDIHRSVKSDGKGDEQGMLSMAFPPDYARSGLFYVAYTDHRDALRLVEFKRSARDPLLADPHYSRLVMRIPEPTTKHHGGLLLFGPDGHLYVGSGDGGPSGDPYGAGQNKHVLLGKILRIDPRPAQRSSAEKTASGKKGKGKGKRRKPKKPAPYTIPKDNPFVGRPGRDEIWAYGLRNPWRFSFDRPTGTIAIGDVGDARYEEIDYLPVKAARGANFGWSAFEGPVPLNGGVPRKRTVPPAFFYPHGPGCAVTGGYVVRDPRLTRIQGREIYGRYLFGDYCSGRLYAFRPRLGRKPGRKRSFRFQVPYLTSFGEDNQGRIYVLTERSVSKRGKPTLGSVYRLDPRRKGD